MSTPMFVAMILCFIPALILLFVMLYRYEGCFDDRKLFMTFAGGMFLGIVALLFEISNIFSLNGSDFTGVISIFGIAFLHEALKTMVLNLKRFQGKFDTTFYGLSIGLGFGAIYGFYAISSQLIKGIDVELFIINTIMVIGIIQFHGALGLMIGYGVSLRKTFRYFGYAILFHIILNAVFFGYLSVSIKILVGLTVFTVIYGTLLLVYDAKMLLPKSLPEKMRKQKRRMLRKV
jgi:hypothetical protein